MSWALIAGGSKRLGFSIAKALARRKYNILLIARAIKPDEAGEAIVRGMLKGKMIIVPGKLARIISYLLRIIPNRCIVKILHSFSQKSK